MPDMGILKPMNLLRPGDPALDFVLPDPVTGSDVGLSDFRQRDVLLVFFRGTWCPFCHAQMRTLRENHSRLSGANIAVVGIVCQSAASVKRYLNHNPLPFPLLVDESREVAKAYGTHYWLSLEGANLSNPAVFVLDREGRITFAHVGRNMRDLPVTAVLERFVAFLDPAA
jgi:peroxiredoxin Q/BCP